MSGQLLLANAPLVEAVIDIRIGRKIPEAAISQLVAKFSGFLSEDQRREKR